MFRRNKKPEFIEEKSKRKFLNHKESAQRIKHLKLLIGNAFWGVQHLFLENLPSSELQKFFEEHHSEIFHHFFDYFDTEIKNKRMT